MNYGSYTLQHVGDYWTHIDIKTLMVGLLIAGLPFAIAMYGGMLLSIYQRHQLKKAIRRKGY